MATGPIQMWARVGVGRAERAEGRSAGAARGGKRARRSGAQPGLDDVEKSVTTPGLDTGLGLAVPGGPAEHRRLTLTGVVLTARCGKDWLVDVLLDRGPL